MQAPADQSNQGILSGRSPIVIWVQLFVSSLIVMAGAAADPAWFVMSFVVLFVLRGYRLRAPLIRYFVGHRLHKLDDALSFHNSLHLLDAPVIL
ncbi:MAG: hypothetical protein WA982_11845 [Rubrobacteraceae bacterium]